MANGQPASRYHAEIKLTVEGKEARINVFADTLNEIFSDLAKITLQYDNLHSAAKREILNAELRAKQHTQQKDAQPTPPACPYCGSFNTELISWEDKTTGELKQAWKCQDCQKWLPSQKRKS